MKKIIIFTMAALLLTSAAMAQRSRGGKQVATDENLQQTTKAVRKGGSGINKAEFGDKAGTASIENQMGQQGLVAFDGTPEQAMYLNEEEWYAYCQKSAPNGLSISVALFPNLSNSPANCDGNPEAKFTCGTKTEVCRDQHSNKGTSSSGTSSGTTTGGTKLGTSMSDTSTIAVKAETNNTKASAKASATMITGTPSTGSSSSGSSSKSANTSAFVPTSTSAYAATPSQNANASKAKETMTQATPTTATNNFTATGSSKGLSNKNVVATTEARDVLLPADKNQDLAKAVELQLAYQDVYVRCCGENVKSITQSGSGVKATVSSASKLSGATQTNVAEVNTSTRRGKSSSTGSDNTPTVSRRR